MCESPTIAARAAPVRATNHLISACQSAFCSDSTHYNHYETVAVGSTANKVLSEAAPAAASALVKSTLASIPIKDVGQVPADETEGAHGGYGEFRLN
jgi:hypothetical protein